MRKTKVLIFVLFLAVFGLFFSGLNVKATVATSDKLVVLGAQVRTSDPAGIRFVGTAADYEGEVTEYGIAIAFGETTAENLLLGETVNGQSVLNASVQAMDGENQFYISLINIPANMYGQKVTARAYVKNGEEVTYGTEVVTRSFNRVIISAYEAGDKTDFVTTAYNNLVKPTFDYNEGEFAAEYEFNIQRYNAGSNTGYYTTVSTKASEASGSNFNWARLYLVKSDIAENLYKVVAALAEGVKASTVELPEYEYVLAAHTSCYDKSSLSTIRSFVANGNVTDYYLSFVMPSTSSCDVDVKADNNASYLTDTPIYLDNSEELPLSKKVNYNFEGWCTDEALTSATTLVHTGASTYYAKFTPTPYTITYELGEGNTTAQLVESYDVEDAVITLPAANTMSIENGNFLGWYDNSSFSGDPITTIDTSKGGNVKVYAKWFVNTTTTVELTAADTAAITALTPTMVVSTTFENGTYVVNGVQYKMNEKAFSSIADALALAEENEKIYVFAGTYATALTVEDASVTLYGPNYGVKGNASRNSEAIVTALTTISANNVTINGLKFTTNGNIKVSANNVTITNIYMNPSKTIACNGQNRQGCIVDGADISDLTISNSYINAPGTSNTYTKQYMSFNYVRNLTFTGNYIINSSATTVADTSSYAGSRIYTAAGTINISNNEFRWATDGYVLYVANAASCTDIKINDNLFDGNGTVDHSATILISGKTTCPILIQGNEFNNFKGSTFVFSSTSTATVTVQYNYFASTTSYKVGTAPSKAITYSNNYYAATQKTATSDYGLVTSKAKLDELYADYKAAN